MAKSETSTNINGKELFAVTCNGCGELLCYIDSEDNPYNEDGERYSWQEYEGLNIWSPNDEVDLCSNCAEHHYICECCDELFHEDEMTYIENRYEWVCNNCRDNNYTQCEHCGNWYHDRFDTHSFYTVDGEDWCFNCVSEDAWRCEHCHEYHSTDCDSYEIVGLGEVCYDCFNDIDTATCEECDREFLPTAIVEGEDEDGETVQLCSECYRHRHPDEFTSVPGYHNDDTPFKAVNAKGELVSMRSVIEERHRYLHMGTEWEIEGGGTNYKKLLDISKALGMAHTEGRCRIERDGSLTDGGELITMPSTLSYFTKQLKLEEGFELAKKYGYRSHDGGHCGAHIHIDRMFFEGSMFNPEYALIILIQNNREWLQSFSRREPSRMGYCSFDGDATPFKAEDFKPSEKGDTDTVSKTLRRLDRLRDNYRGHGMALNFAGSSTMEIRFFRGSLVPRTIRANHELVEMLGYAMKHFSDVQLCNVNLQWFKRFAKRKGFTNFLEYIEERGIISA